MKLYFENSKGEERLIAECETVQDTEKEISKFLEDHNYNSYYSRIWGNDERIMVDVGSYSEFFIIKGIPIDEYVKALQKDDGPKEEYHQITFDEYLESLQN